MMCKQLNGSFIYPGPETFVLCKHLVRVGGKKFNMVFYFKNESKIKPFYLSGKIDNACITGKKGQGAFLTAEKTGRAHFKQQKNRQGTF